MIGYGDRTFCSALCRARGCDRRWTKPLQDRARRWYGGEGAPVAFSNFAPTCADYDPPAERGRQLEAGGVNV